MKVLEKFAVPIGAVIAMAITNALFSKQKAKQKKQEEDAMAELDGFVSNAMGKPDFITDLDNR